MRSILILISLVVLTACDRPPKREGSIICDSGFTTPYTNHPGIYRGIATWSVREKYFRRPLKAGEVCYIDWRDKK